MTNYGIFGLTLGDRNFDITYENILKEWDTRVFHMSSCMLDVHE